MKHEKNYSFYEAVADISYIAGQNKFHSGDSRSDIAMFVRWAEEFENLHAETEWGENIDYIDTIYSFASAKLQMARSGVLQPNQSEGYISIANKRVFWFFDNCRGKKLSKKATQIITERVSSGHNCGEIYSMTKTGRMINGHWSIVG